MENISISLIQNYFRTIFLIYTINTTLFNIILFQTPPIDFVYMIKYTMVSLEAMLIKINNLHNRQSLKQKDLINLRLMEYSDRSIFLIHFVCLKGIRKAFTFKWPVLLWRSVERYCIV